MKRVIVTGSAGFIGFHLCKKLLDKGFNVLGVDDFTDYYDVNLKHDRNQQLKSSNQFTLLKMNIEDEDFISRATEYSPDYIIHLAAQAGVRYSLENPRTYINTNINGTFNVMEACRINKVKKLIYSSSASVYGDAIHSPMREDHPYLNKNFYGATKICCEALLRSYYYRYNLNYLGLRYMNVYGPRQDYNGAYIAVMMRMIDNIQRGKRPKVIGTGNEGFDFVSVKDCAEANICALESEKKMNFIMLELEKKLH